MLVSVGHLSFVSTIVITGVTHSLSSPVGQRNLNNNKFRHFYKIQKNFKTSGVTDKRNKALNVMPERIQLAKFDQDRWRCPGGYQHPQPHIP